MMFDDDTTNVNVDRVSWITVVLPVWKPRRCTLECVPWTSTQAVKQQKGQGNCAEHAEGQREEKWVLVLLCFTFSVVEYAYNIKGY